MAKVGYARVSSVGQSLDVQREKLGGCDKLFEEKRSGTTDARPMLKQCLGYVREGDQLIVTRIDRLARSTLHLCQIAETLRKTGVDLVVLDQNIDTSDATGRLLFNMLGAIGQFECIFRDIRPPIPTTSAHLYRGIRPALTRCREALVFDISFLAFRHVVEGLSFGRIVRRVRAGRRCAPAGRGWHLRRWVHQ